MREVWRTELGDESYNEIPFPFMQPMILWRLLHPVLPGLGTTIIVPAP